MKKEEEFDPFVYVFKVFSIGFVFAVLLSGCIAYGVIRHINAKPFSIGQSVKIVANQKQAIVLNKSTRYVSVSYADDAGRMNTSWLLYTQVEPWKETR